MPTGRWLNAQEQRKHLEGVPSAKDTVLSEGGDALRIESKPVIDFDDKLGLFKDSNRLALVSVLKLQLPNNIRSVTDVSFAREFQALRVEMAVDLLAKMKRHGHVFVQRDASPASVDNFHDIDDIVKSVAPAIWDTIHVGIDMILGLRELNGDHCVRDAVDLTRLYMSLAELILIWKEDVIGARQLLNSAACSLGQVLRMAAATLDTHDLRQWLDLNFQRLRLETFTTDQVASTQALKTVYRLSQRFASSQHQLRCHILALENGLNLGDASPSLYGDKPVARVIIAEYLEAIGDFHWRSGELSAASSIYNNALDERERHAADSLRIFLKLEHGALSWDRASTMAKICRLSRKTGSNSRFPLPPVDALLDEVGILPLALARWSLEEETAANGNISKHWDRLFMMHVNTLGYDSEGIEEMLLSYLKVCSSSVGVELRSAIVYALACVCRASRALKSSAFTIATDIQTVIAAAPLGIRAAVMASGCAKNVPPPAELWDILSANADAVRSALAKMQSVDVHADEVVASFLKLSNVSRRDMNLLDVTTAALELHRSQLHRYLCETSSTYAEQCQTGLKPSPLEKILPVGVDILAIVWHRHGEDATLCQGTVVVVNSLSATPYEPKIVDFDAASADIADVLHESQQLLQSLCGGGVAVDVNDLFEKIVRRAQMIFRCGPGVSKVRRNW